MKYRIPILLFSQERAFFLARAFRKRRSLIETQLIFATRELMIKLKSGVPIFNALLDIAMGDYGLVSSEFKIAAEEIESGIPQDIALDNLSRRVPSQSFKRTIDIMLNAMRSGSDLAATLDIINDMLVRKQQSDMQAYAGELTPLSMGYMLIAVVVPSLGMSVFLILGSMAKINVTLFIYFIPALLIMFEVLFIGLVKSRRPAVGV